MLTANRSTPSAAQTAALGRISRDLHGASIDSRVANDGDLLFDFHAMGHRFRFRIDPQGVVTERSCHADPGGVLARPEMEILRTLAEKELACHGRGHLISTIDGINVLGALRRAEIKLALALTADDGLTGEERRVLTGILASYQDGVREDCDPTLRQFLTATLGEIRRKLGL
ncbi:MAG: hypothetical protein ABSH36_02625 [Solirubrobacteraceae bacterium]